MIGFGDRLRQFRQAKGLSLDKLASETGISRAYLWKLERKANVNPSIDLIEKLAEALGTTIGDLAVDATTKPREAQEIPDSLRIAQAEYGLSNQDVGDLARIRFRGGHPTDPEDWYLLYLQLKRVTGARSE